MDSVSIMLNEISQAETDKCCMISHICAMFKKKGELVETENGLVVARSKA